VTIAQMEDVKLRRLAPIVDEWKKLTKGKAAPILAVTIVYSDYLAKNPEAVAKFIAATRKAVEYGSKNKPRVAELLQKTANMNSNDARAYADQWDGAYMATFEPQDITSLKRMHEIVKAEGGIKKDPRKAPSIPARTRHLRKSSNGNGLIACGQNTHMPQQAA
jgi:NitT/TauT family transport system substrate-binding protein